MDKRVIALFKVLAKADGYLTSEEICEQIGIRPRTLRECVRQYRTMIEKESGAVLESKTNQGYRLVIHDEKQFYDFLHKLMEEESRNQLLMPVNQEDRVHYIIRYFLGKGGYVKLEDLADELYVSKSTLWSSVKAVKEKLAEFDLNLEQKAGQGFRIVGEEMNIRGCMAEYYFHAEDYDAKQLQLRKSGMFDEEHERVVSNILYEAIKAANFKLTDIGFHNLVVHLLIAIKRIQDEIYFDEQAEKLEELQQSEEWTLATNVADALEEKFDINIPEGEVGYITMHLMGKRMFDSQENSLIRQDTMDLVQQILDEIKDYYGYDFSGDLRLATMMALHLQPMIARIEYGLKMQNPLINRIKEENPLAFEMSLLAGKVVERALGESVSENELGYLAMHFQLAMESNRPADKKRILVVCASGAGTSQIMKHKIEQRFKDQVEKVETTNAMSMDSVDQTRYDLVVTTIPLDVKLNIPVLQISYFLGQDEYDNIEQVLLHDKKEVDMIRSCFRPELFLVRDEATQAEVIHSLCEALKKDISLPDEFEQLVWEREHLSDTVMGNDVAVPHPTRLVSKDTRVAIMHVRKGVQWGTHKVKWIFLLGVKQDADDLTTVFNHVLSALIGSKEVLRKLNDMPTYYCFMENISAITRMADFPAEEDIFA